MENGELNIQDCGLIDYGLGRKVIESINVLLFSILNFPFYD